MAYFKRAEFWHRTGKGVPYFEVLLHHPRVGAVGIHDPEVVLAAPIGDESNSLTLGGKGGLDKNIDFNRIRKEGAGRPRVEKKHRKSLRRSSS